MRYFLSRISNKADLIPALIFVIICALQDVQIFLSILWIAALALTVYIVSRKRRGKVYRSISEEMKKVDGMKGTSFEKYFGEVLKCNGYKKVSITKKSGDYGADIIASYQHRLIAFQCKRYDKPVGIKGVQEAAAAQKYYGCCKAVVVTNNSFTKNARNLAQRTNVELWDRKKLCDLIYDAQKNRNFK